MWQDPIVEEVRQAREAHAALYNYDLEAIYRALKEEEERHKEKLVSFPPKRIPPPKKDKPALVVKEHV